MTRRILWLPVLILTACGRSFAPNASMPPADVATKPSVTAAAPASTSPSDVATEPLVTAAAPASPPLGLNTSVRTSGDIVALDGAGRVRYRAPHALVTPSRNRMISTTGDEATTVVQTIDPLDGRVLFSQKLAGELVPVAISTSGQRGALATAAYDPPAAGEIAVGRATTTIAVIDTDASHPPQTITLAGNFVPEGFTRDNTALAAIEFLPAEHPVEYRVRVIDLTRPSALQAPFGWLTKEPLDMKMAGLRGSHVLTSDGQFLYTLYRAHDGTAFVHSLGLDIGRQYCVNLPASLDLGVTTGAIGAAPDGAHLYLVTATGKLAEIATGVASGENPSVTRVVDLGVTGDRTPPAVTVTASRLYASLGDQLVTVELASFESSRTPLSAPASALAVEPSQGTVYASSAKRIWTVGSQPSSALTLPAGIGAVSELYLG